MGVQRTGYFMLGRIIEKVSGKPYHEFLSDSILKPLKMNDTGEFATTVAGLATGYTAKDEKAVWPEKVFLFSAGSHYSTVDDLFRLDQALGSEKLLTRQMVAKMLTPVVRLVDMEDISFGFG